MLCMYMLLKWREISKWILIHVFPLEKDGDDDVDHGSTMKKTDDSTMKSSSGTLYSRASKCIVWSYINSMHAYVTWL